MFVNWRAFGADVMRAREDNKMTMKDLAKRTGTSLYIVDHAERGDGVRAGAFLSLCRWLGADAELYLERE